jgi:hypothetical protein
MSSNDYYNNYAPPPGPPPGKAPGAGAYPPPPANYYGNNAYQGASSYQPPPISLEEQHGQGPIKFPPQEPPPPYTFEEKFALPKPKYHDLWAAILFLVDLFGLVVVSGISLNAYRATKGTNGNGIYDGRGNDFGLSTNTIVLFMFVLVVALGASALYFLLARTLTKQLIWITGILK